MIVLSSDDPEGDDLEYSFNLDNGTGVLEDDILTITPDSNFNGNIELTVLVSDGELSDSETLTIDILPVNDAHILLRYLLVMLKKMEYMKSSNTEILIMITVN